MAMRKKHCVRTGVICAVNLLTVSDTNSQHGNTHKIITVGATFKFQVSTKIQPCF